MINRLKRWALLSFAGILLGATSLCAETLTIDDVVRDTLKHNPAVAGAEANLAASKEGLKQARANRLPSLSAGYSWTGLHRAPSSKSPAGTMEVGYKNQAGWNLQVSQPLFTGFSLSSAQELARLGVDTRELEKRQTLQGLRRDAKLACHRLLLAERLLAVAEDEVASLADHKRVAKLSREQGLIPPNDLLKADVALAQAIQRRDKAESEREKAKLLILRLTGKDLSQPLSLKDVHAPPVWAQKGSELESLALERRPLVALLRLNVSQASTRETLAKSAWYPHVNLVGRYAKNGDSPMAHENDFTHRDTASVSLQASWTLWNWGKTGAGVAEVTHQKRAIEASLLDAETAVRQEVQNALLDRSVALKNIATAEQSRSQALENWRITRAQYDQQVATSTDVIDARSFLTTADSNYYMALYAYLDALALLDYATGSGS